MNVADLYIPYFLRMFLRFWLPVNFSLSSLDISLKFEIFSLKLKSAVKKYSLIWEGHFLGVLRLFFIGPTPPLPLKIFLLLTPYPTLLTKSLKRRNNKLRAILLDVSILIEYNKPYCPPRYHCWVSHLHKLKKAKTEIRMN